MLADNRKQISLRLKYARENIVKLNIEEAAKLAGLSVNYMIQIESGSAIFTSRLLKKFADLYNVPEDYFYRSEDPRQDYVQVEPMSAENHRSGSSILNQILELLKGNEEVQKKIRDYLISYHKGGKEHLSSIGGMIDTISDEEAEQLISLLVRKLRRPK